MNEIEKSIKEDIRDMKRIGRNIKHVKGKRGYVGKMYDPNRGLSEKKIKKLYETGEIKVYDMAKIVKINEFKYLDDSMKKTYLDTWRKKYGNEHIAKEMGVGISTLYKMFKAHNVDMSAKPKIHKRNYAEIKPKEEVVETNEVTQVVEEPTIEIKEKKVEQEPKPKQEKVVIDNRNQLDTIVELKGKMKGNTLSEKLRALAMLVDDEMEYDYFVTLKK